MMSKMIKNKPTIIAIILLSIMLSILTAEFLLRKIGYEPAHINESKFILSIEPDSFEVPDAYLGWRLGKGCYTTMINDSPLFSHCTNDNFTRIIPFKSDSNVYKTIHLYGCSYTFGYTVSDSETMAYYLQDSLRAYKIINKGVPGFGLLQMYLLLKKDIEENLKPDIAVFNYAKFQEERTPLNKEWIKAFKYAAIQSGGKNNFRINYPYAVVNSNKNLIIRSMMWDDLPKDFYLRDKSAIVNLLETAIDKYYYEKIKDDLSFINYCIAIETFRLCNEHKINLLFGGIDADSQKLLETLKVDSIPTLYYDIDISIPENNCHPLDPSHPSALAHRKYAHKIITALTKYGWL